MLPFQKHQGFPPIRTTPSCERQGRKRSRDVTPIASLLDQIKALRSIFSDLNTINSALAPYVQDALVHDDGQDASLLELFEKFSWCKEQSKFQATPDLYCLSSALSKHRFIKVKTLGAGSYAVVYKARNRETDEYIALKKLRFGLDSQGIPSSTLREITLLRDLKHPNIVEIKDVIWSFGSPSVYVVLECLDCDLREHIDSCVGASDITNVKAFVYQILKALSFAHSNRVMHRDLKPQNILVDRANQQLKIADFGLARAYLPPYRAYTEKVVTLWYRSPELLLGAPHYTTAVDIWSIGCIFGEMLNYEPIFKSESEVGLLHRIFYLLGTPTPEQWKELDTHTHYRDSFPQWRPQAMADVFPKLANDPQGLDLLSSMLQLDPSKRITATAALEHPWLAETRAAEAALRSHCWQPDSPSAFAANLASALQTAQFQSPASSEGSTYTPPFRQPAAPAAAAGPHAAGAAQPPRPSRLSRSSSGVHAQPLPQQEQQQQPSQQQPQLRAGTTSLGRFAAVARQPVALPADPQQQLLCTSPSELPRSSKAAALQHPAGNINSNESDQDHHSLAHHQQHMGPPRPPARTMPSAHHQPATASTAPAGVAARGSASGMLLGPGSSTYMPSERA